MFLPYGYRNYDKSSFVKYLEPNKLISERQYDDRGI